MNAEVATSNELDVRIRAGKQIRDKSFNVEELLFEVMA